MTEATKALRKAEVDYFREWLKELRNEESLCHNCARQRAAVDDYDAQTDPRFPHHSFVALPKTGSTLPRSCLTHVRKRKFVFY